VCAGRAASVVSRTEGQFKRASARLLLALRKDPDGYRIELIERSRG